MRRLTVVPQLDSHPALVRLAQSAGGKLLLLAAFAVGLRLLNRSWWLEMVLILAALTFLPAWRRSLIALGCVWWWIRHVSFHTEPLAGHVGGRGGHDGAPWLPAAVGLVLLFCVGFLYLLRSDKGRRLLRRPVLALLVAYAVLVLAARFTPIGGWAGGFVWVVLAVYVRYVWFLGYSAIQREGRVHPVVQVGHFIPFWSPVTSVPFPKAGGYLSKIEAADGRELAVCQLKGLKLLIWAGWLLIASWLFEAVVHGAGRARELVAAWHFDLPTLPDTLAAHVGGLPHSWQVSWLSLIAYFLLDLLHMAVWGHIIIACCRMAGFKALRNTYRPLESVSVAEFWNRYYYYYKEFLLDFFFYPAFLRYFRKHPRWRRFFATLAAATLGNFLFHYVRDVHEIAAHGPWGAAVVKHNFALYALLLGLGIGVSQLRGTHRGRQMPWLQRRILAPAGVMLFYCILSVFLVHVPANAAQRIAFLLGLVGWGR